MAQTQIARVVGLGRNDPLFARICAEAEEGARREDRCGRGRRRARSGSEPLTPSSSETGALYTTKPPAEI